MNYKERRNSIVNKIFKNKKKEKKETCYELNYVYDDIKNILLSVKKLLSTKYSDLYRKKVLFLDEKETKNEMMCEERDKNGVDVFFSDTWIPIAFFDIFVYSKNTKAEYENLNGSHPLCETISKVFSDIKILCDKYEYFELIDYEGEPYGNIHIRLK